MSFRHLRLALLCLIPLSAFAGDPPPNTSHLGVEVTDVRDPLQICDCTQPANLGRICISATRFRFLRYLQEHPQPGPPQGPIDLSAYTLTEFEAHIDGADVVLTSKAYYEQCVYEGSVTHYLDQELEQIAQQQHMFGVKGVRGVSPGMQVAMVTAANVTGPYSPLLRGAFAEQQYRSNEGTRYEMFRTEYPGTVEFRKPILGFLTDSQVRVVLDGNPLKRYLKAWLGIETAPGRFINFGEYTITLRFFRKPGTILHSQWDTSVIGVEILPGESQ